MSNTLYLDMDGVLADFNGWAAEVLMATDQERAEAAAAGRWKPQQWQQLIRDPHLYRKLPKTDIADELVALARQFRTDLGWNIRILTAIPKANDVPDAFQDKIEWVQQYYSDIRVHFGPYSRDKHRHAHPGDLLIDDRADNCTDWSLAGGQIIRVWDHDRQQAIRELTSMYTQLKNFISTGN